MAPAEHDPNQQHAPAIAISARCDNQATWDYFCDLRDVTWPRIPATRSAGLLIDLRPKEGAGNAGCALHPRSRVQNCAKNRTRAYRFSENTPAFPAQWLYGLCRDLLGDEFVLSPSLPA